MTILKHMALAGLGLLIGTSGALAQSAADFFKGRQLTMLVYSGAGSTYDMYARLLAKHMPNHLPGKPTIITQYMVGAGGLKQVDYMNKIAPRDGTVFGTIGRGLAFEPMLGKNEVGFDPLKFNWLGSMNREITVALSWNTAKIKTFEDLKTMELLVPGTGAGADSEIVPRAYNSLAGTKFKIISGYRDTSEAALQMETGELTGLAYWSWSSIIAAHPDWIRDKLVHILIQFGRNKLPQLPDVPTAIDVVKDPIDKEALAFYASKYDLAYTMITPPGVPAERIAALRTAFDQTMRDPEYQANAKKIELANNPLNGDEVTKLVNDIQQAPQGAVDRMRDLMTVEKK